MCVRVAWFVLLGVCLIKCQQAAEEVPAVSIEMPKPANTKVDSEVEQIKLLQGIDLETQAFQLVDIHPIPNSHDVRSELAEAVFRFQNVTANYDASPGRLRFPKLLSELILVHRNDSTKNETSKSFWYELRRPKMNLSHERLKTVQRGKTLYHGRIRKNNSEVVVITDEGDTKGQIQVTVQFPTGIDFSYNSSYTIVLSEAGMEGMEEYMGGVLKNWVFTTEKEPEKPGASTLLTAKNVSVFGVGIFLLDVGDVDLRKGTFKADVQIFLLKYYITFNETETAIRESMNENRTCKDVSHGEKFQYVQNASQDDLLARLSFINTVQKPTPEVFFDGNLFDHYRVRTSFTFSPKIANYPFQSQDLPIELEIAGQSVVREPTALLCVLETFSGFAGNLSSLEVHEKLQQATYTSAFSVEENRNWPPLEGHFVPPFRFPHDSSVSRQPTRVSSRLKWVTTLHRPHLIGMLELAPSLFIASSALVSYFLPISEFRARLTTCTTALLAAVVQHSSIRSHIPERGSVTNADLVMLVVYSLISLATASAVTVSVVAHHRKLSVQTEYINGLLRALGLCSPLLFMVFPLGGGREVFSWLLTFIVIAMSTVVFHYFTYAETNPCCRSGPVGEDDDEYKPVARTFSTHLLAECNSEAVADWVENLRLDDTTRADMKLYATAFFMQRIDGSVLPSMDKSMIRSLGIPLGHSIKLYGAIQDALSAKVEVGGPEYSSDNEEGSQPIVGNSEIEMILKK